MTEFEEKFYKNQIIKIPAAYMEFDPQPPVHASYMDDGEVVYFLMKIQGVYPEGTEVSEIDKDIDLFKKFNNFLGWAYHNHKTSYKLVFSTEEYIEKDERLKKLKQLIINHDGEYVFVSPVKTPEMLFPLSFETIKHPKVEIV